jgi:hypothetical protein
MSGTPFLFYGPGAFEAASKMAAEIGEPLPPVGGEGLKVKDSRDLVTLAIEGVVGESQPSVVVGPMNSATPEAADALLKTLEEVGGIQLLRFVLWSENLYGVIQTIQSRCNCIWSPGSIDNSVDGSVEEFLDFFMEGKHAEAIGVLSGQSDWGGFLSSVTDLISMRIHGCSDSDSEKMRDLWFKIRPLMDTKYAGRAGVILPVSRIFCG